MRNEAIEAVRLARVRRLEILEQQIAFAGRNAEPEDIIERDDLMAKLGLLESAQHSKPDSAMRAIVRDHYRDDLDFLIDQLGKFGLRLTRLEQGATEDRVSRIWRQRLTDVWMVVSLTLLLFIIAARVF